MHIKHMEFLETLIQKKQEVETLLNHLKTNLEDYDNLFAHNEGMDESDHAQREISASNHYRLMERKARELRQIERLIQRVSNDGQFGKCEECGDPIPLGRLLIVPEATLCVACQQDLEKFSRMRPSGPKNRWGHEAKKSSEWAEEEDLDDLENDLMASGIYPETTSEVDDFEMSQV